MSYISYENVPLKLGPNANTSSLPSSLNEKVVFCQQVQLNHTPNIQQTRLLGKRANEENFNLAGPPNSTLSFTAYVSNTDFDPNDYTGDVGDLGTTFKLGAGLEGSGLFLNSFSFSLTPYQPVLVQADFAIYNPLSISGVVGGVISGDSNGIGQNLDFSKYGHGAYSTFDGSELDDINIFESIQYQFTANRRPVYEVGNFNPSVVELLTAEQSVQIQGDNIQSLLPLSGENYSGNMEIKNPDGDSLFALDFFGRMNAENVTIEGGDLARGSVTIVEPLK